MTVGHGDQLAAARLVNLPGLQEISQRCRPTGPTHGDLASPGLTPVLSCLCPPALRLAPHPLCRFVCVCVGVSPPVVAAPRFPSRSPWRGATSVPLAVEISLQLLVGLVTTVATLQQANGRQKYGHLASFLTLASANETRRHQPPTRPVGRL